MKAIFSLIGSDAIIIQNMADSMKITVSAALHVIIHEWAHTKEDVSVTTLPCPEGGVPVPLVTIIGSARIEGDAARRAADADAKDQAETVSTLRQF